MSFQGIRRSIDPMFVFGKRGWFRAPLAPIVFDESPAGYSSAGCSPAEPASASPAGLHVTLAGAGEEEQLSQRRVLNLAAVSKKGAPQLRSFIEIHHIHRRFPRFAHRAPHKKSGK
jgi:hypothetical protein